MRKYKLKFTKGKNGYRLTITAPNGRIIESAAGQQYSRKVDALRTLKSLANAIVCGRLVVEN